MRNLSEHALWPNGLLRWAAALLMAAVLWLPAGPAGAAITLAEMSATAQPDGSILVRWVTATELNSSQFILYRSEQADGPWDNEVNRQDAKDLDGILGATYIYTDTSVILNTKYYYVLGEIEKNGNLIKYPDARISATAGQAPAATATATPTSTATPTQIASLTPTATPSRTPAGTSTATPPRGAQEQPTATRQFTNTPTSKAPATGAPTAPGTAGAPPQPGQTTATPLGTVAIATATRGASSPAISPAPAPNFTRLPVPPAAATPAPTMLATAPPGSILPGAATDTPTAQVTRPPQIFEPVATGQPLTTTPGRPAPRPTTVPADQAARNTRLMLFLGGGAIGLAALLGVVAMLIWRARSR